MKLIHYILGVYLVLLIITICCGFTYKTEATLSEEQTRKLDQVQTELKKTNDIQSLSYGSGILTIRSNDELSQNDIDKLKDKAEKFVTQKTDVEKAQDYLNTVDLNDATKTKDIVKNLAIIQGIKQ